MIDDLTKYDIFTRTLNQFTDNTNIDPDMLAKIRERIIPNNDTDSLRGLPISESMDNTNYPFSSYYSNVWEDLFKSKVLIRGSPDFYLR